MGTRVEPPAKTGSLSLKPKHLKRYKDIARLWLKYGRSDFVKQAGLSELLQEEKPAAADDPGDLAHDLEALGPTFIKLGQVLSTRADLLPAPYLESLSRLQDNVEPFTFGEVEQIITEELGVRISKIFPDFATTPIAAASLGQVHRARLRDGREVVVKVQRPHVREQIADDLEALAEMAGFADAHTEAGRRYRFTLILDEFHKSLWRELDYRQEANNLKTLAANLAEFPLIVVPQPYEDFTTSRVLTMDYIAGKKITDLPPIARLDYDGTILAEQLFQAYLKQILVDGFFHADPHPGNVFLTDDYRVALLDLGMVGHMSSRLQEDLLQLLIAVSTGRSNEAASLALKISQVPENFDRAAFRREIADLVGTHQLVTLAQLQVGTLMLRLNQIAGAHALLVPPELTMLGKTLLNLDLIGRTLDPEFDPNAAVRRHAAELWQRRALQTLHSGSWLGGLVELKDLVLRLPRRLNRLLDAVSTNDWQIRVHAFDEATLIDGLQKIANRITVGLILAALIIGAALLMHVSTEFRLWGYPGLAMVCFLLAGAGGVALVLNILLHDRHPRK